MVTTHERQVAYPVQPRPERIPEYEIKRNPHWKEIHDVANHPDLYAALRRNWELHGYDWFQEQAQRFNEPTITSSAKRSRSAQTHFRPEAGTHSYQVLVKQHPEPFPNMPVGGITLEIPINNQEANLCRVVMHITYREVEEPPVLEPGTKHVLVYGRHAGLAIEVEVDPSVSPDNLVFYSVPDLLKFLKRKDAFKLLCLRAH